ncbi:RNA polymerase sigma factor [Gelidibacter salicanalis]|uniref:RNA polymerase sigma-70 factor n=1 Tax=Gelidibacter salicanalis TaxID=291193 RepID=A0A934KX47_9FLAO|nr:RNA polymerase sigma-70 factor [Gelidibacter salicanalis]MBJ7882483.1 RNA polymerase sigma-70 factor [Gelidibacter salicanalis]
MERIKCSDKVSFGILYNRLWEPMYVKAYSITGDKNLAKDIVQDIWISVWERKATIANENIEGYLFRAVRYKVYNEFRNSKYRNMLIEEFVRNYNLPIEANSIDQDFQLKHTEKKIRSSVMSLPTRCKEVFELSRFDGMKNHEIAKKLNISQRTVETHISNALKVLRKHTALILTISIRILHEFL